MHDTSSLILLASNAAIEAGAAIMDVYNSEIKVDLKDDRSPLTEADRRAHAIIAKTLELTNLPLLSEEGRSIPFEERQNWDTYWLVDPLDGTKEFIRRNGEFTVNIALMKGNYPIAGVIYVPVKNILYFGIEGHGGYKAEGVNSTFNSYQEILDNASNLPMNDSNRPFTIVGSKSHPSPETQEYIEEQEKRYNSVEIISMGSSLKLCLVAEGVADVYPRFAPTMEWDTAAGQAIVEASGSSVISWTNKQRMPYNKENLLNDWFLVSRNSQDV